MKKLYGLALAALAFCIASPVFTVDSRIYASDKAEKELKRMANRYRIPVETLENALEALEEATDLAKSMDPLPINQVSNIASSWTNLSKSRAESVIESFLLSLLNRAGDTADYLSYQQATSAAGSLFTVLGNLDPEKASELSEDWPYPLEDWGEAALKVRETMVAQVKRNALIQLAGKDPESALGQLSLMDDSDLSSQNVSTSLVYSLMNKGMEEEAQGLISRTILNLAENIEDSNSLSQYQNYASNMLRFMDSAEAQAIVNHLVQITDVVPSNSQAWILEKGESSVEMTQDEYNFLNMLRSLSNRPELLINTLNSYPGLRSKLEVFGGIDGYLSSGSYGGDRVKSRPARNTPVKGFVTGTGGSLVSGGSTTGTRDDLIRELQQKAESEPDYVERMLREEAEGKDGAQRMIQIAQQSTYDYPDLAEIALEVARDLLPRIEGSSSRSSVMRNLISAYRRLDGEVDEDILKEGYILADQIRLETLSRNKLQAGMGGSAGIDESGIVIMTGISTFYSVSNADQLESFLVAQLARDDFEKAIRYVRSMESDNLKLECLIQIAQALRNPYN